MSQQAASFSRLIERLEAACAESRVEDVCTRVKEALTEEVRVQGLQLPEDYLQQSDNCYARNLLHRCANGKFTVVVMVWGPNQGTPIHDHDGKWCVECVYQGKIRVTSYDLVAEADEGVEFRRSGDVVAEIGEAGTLIPPYDYHVIENAGEPCAVTIHVYGGEMNGCHVFQPIEGKDLYAREWRDLCYTNS